MQYHESEEIQDSISNHNGYIEKMYYFQQIDKVILFEQNQRVIKIYDAPKMVQEEISPGVPATIQCSGPILAIEYISDRNAIAISLADLTIRFYDMGSNQGYRFMRTLHVPSTQKCLAYVKSHKTKKILFSGGVQGAIFAWDINKLFEKDYVLQPGDPDFSGLNDGANNASYMEGGKGKRGQADGSRDKLKAQYITYIAENTPWFVGDFILCLQYLPVINLLASGVYDNKIRLWDLRANQVDPDKHQGDFDSEVNSKKVLSKDEKEKVLMHKELKRQIKHDTEINLGNSKKDKIKEHFKDIEFNRDILNDEVSTSPIRVLEGHQRAVREIAYSETHKIIVSCGFDFEVFVWNPYMSKRIIALEGHEHPLVGVNCLPALNCFITADTKGMVKVWNILDYSCI